MIWVHIVLIALGLVCIIAAAFTYFSSRPTCNQYGCALAPSYMDHSSKANCLYVKEVYSDSKIPAPTSQLYLGGFSYAPGVGPPLCTKMWYAYRYVRNRDGGYGKLSSWTPKPIYSGASSQDLPIFPSTLTIPNSCTFNQPKLVLTAPPDIPIAPDDINSYTINIHRQVNDTGVDPNDEGEIVGSLALFGQPQNGVYGFFIDAAFNPKVTTRSSCC